MIIDFEDRPSDSPFVERIWRSRSEQGGWFTSLALSHCQLVIWQAAGQTLMSLRGPETKPSVMPVPVHDEYIGIVFNVGTIMPQFPTGSLVDHEVTLPDASSQSVWLNGSAWQFPTYENADTFVDRLVHEAILVRDATIDAALQNQPLALSPRSVQRRFLQATGLTHGTIRQIDQARHATLLLKQGVSILDTVTLAGYADQPHLTRSLKRLVGQTPAQLRPTNQPEQLSFLFKTDNPD
jgi:AraC-like DNA-binding protein